MIKLFNNPLAMRSPTKVTAKQADPFSLIAGMGTSLLGAYFQNKMVNSTNATNKLIADKTNRWQYEIAQENNQAALNAMREQNEFNRQMVQEQNEYNSPLAQSQRLLDAGFNPAVAMQNNAVSQGNQSSPAQGAAVPSMSMPNFVTPTMQAPPSVLLGAVDAVSKLASAKKELSTSDLTDKQKSRYNEQVDAEIRHQLSQANKADEEARYQELLNNVERWQLPKRKEAEYKNLVRQFYLAIANEDLAKAQKSAVEIDNKLKDENLAILKEQHPFIVNRTKEEVNLLQEKQKTEQTQQGSNVASAHASEASAQYSESMKQAQDILNEFLPEKQVQDLGKQAIELAGAVLTSGRARNVTELIDMLINSGVRKRAAESIADYLQDMRSKFKK